MEKDADTVHGRSIVSPSNRHYAHSHNFTVKLTIAMNSYITSILAFKLSLLLSYLRFMPKGAYRYITFVVILLTILFHLAFLLVQINLCQPVSARSTI